ncbi:MAG: hypothetical protein AAB524_01450 [Patescibacteria group bacterium]
MFEVESSETRCFTMDIWPDIIVLAIVLVVAGGLGGTVFLPVFPWEKGFPWEKRDKPKADP